MTQEKEKTRGRVRLLSLLIGAGVIGLVFFLYFSKIGFLEVLDYKVLDYRFKLRGKVPPGDTVVVVAIDEKSLAKIGKWPWPRNIMATLIDRLREAGARTIGIDVIFSEPDENQRLVATGMLKKRFEELGLNRRGQEERRFYQEMSSLMTEADTDYALASAIKQAGNVILPLFFIFQEEEAVAERKATIPAEKGAFLSFGNFSQRKVFRPFKAGWVTTPLDPLIEAASAVGHVNIIPDSDGTVRWEPLAVQYGEEYYPSFPLQVARSYLGVPLQEMKLIFGVNVQMDNISIPINEEGRLLINYAGDVRTFRHLSVADILAGQVPPEAFKDRIVLIGATAVGIFDLRVTPFSPVFPGIEKQANVVQNILARNFLRRPNWMALVDLAAVAIMAGLLATLLARMRPLTGIALAIGTAGLYFAIGQLAFTQAGVWIRFIYPGLTVSFTYIGVTLLRLLTEERERRFIKGAFQQYVSQEVVEEIVKNPESLKFGGERKVLTVLFSDIRGFTHFSEDQAPEEVVETLHEYMTTMVDVVFKHGGTLDKFMGDAIMAIFGAPVYYEDHALRACLAALEMTRELERLNQKWSLEGKNQFKIGVGVNTGEMVVGNLGSAQRFDFTVIGDNVNLAARLEAATKDYVTKLNVIISEDTYHRVKERLTADPLGSMTIRGKTRNVTLYQLTGEA